MTMTVTSATRLNAVIGNPLTHTLSPLLHSHSYALHGIDAVMLAFGHADVKMLVQAIRALNIGLTAVTIPHKETILPLLDVVDPTARTIGSVNTVIQDGGKLRGYNTDSIGIQRALNGIALKDTNALILGAGGAARAVAFVLSAAGAHVCYANRTPENAQALAHQFGGTGIALEQVNENSYDLIINTTPVGMSPDVQATLLPHYAFHAGQTVMDCIYNPRETTLLRSAREAGASIIPGIEMFIAQGIEQIRLWSGVEVAPEEWRAVIEML